MSLPLLFTLPPSSRHEIILLDTNTKQTLKALNKQVTAVIGFSPNCEEPMAKYKKVEEGKQEIIQDFKIHWDLKYRDSKIWPQYTVLTDANFAAVIEMLKTAPGRDVLEVKVGVDE